MRGLNLVRIDHARRGEETHNVNRLALCRPWNQEHFSTHEELPDGDDNDDADIVGEDKPKFDTRMDREPKVGELLLIKLKPPTKKTRVGTEEFCPFGIVRFKGIDQGFYGFQWMANYNNTPHGVRRMGWVSRKDTKHYYSNRKITPADVPLTHVHTKTWINKKDVLAQGFKLLPSGKPSMSLFQFISDNKRLPWKHPNHQ